MTEEVNDAERLARYPNASQLADQRRAVGVLVARAIADMKLRQWCIETAVRGTYTEPVALIAAADAIYRFVAAPPAEE